jgi:hypothetical protein
VWCRDDGTLRAQVVEVWIRVLEQGLVGEEVDPIEINLYHARSLSLDPPI